MNNMSVLSGQKIVVTGGLRGIVKSIIDEIAKEGDVKIAILAKEKNENTDDVLSEYRSKYNTDARFIATDIRSSTSIKESIEKVAQKFGGIDIVINAATVAIIKPMKELTDDILDISYNVNARSSFLVSQYAYEYLAQSGKGQVLNIAPPINLDPKPLSIKTAYASSQYMKSMITVAQAENEQWREKNILVNALWPLYPFTDGENMHLYQQHTEKSGDKKEIKTFGEAALSILKSADKGWNGEFFYDVEVLDMNSTESPNETIYNYNRSFNQQEDKEYHYD